MGYGGRGEREGMFSSWLTLLVNWLSLSCSSARDMNPSLAPPSCSVAFELPPSLAPQLVLLFLGLHEREVRLVARKQAPDLDEVIAGTLLLVLLVLLKLLRLEARWWCLCRGLNDAQGWVVLGRVL